MSEHTEETRRRQIVLRAMGLVLVGAGSCPGCGQQREIFARRRVLPEPGQERCLDCWRAER